MRRGRPPEASTGKMSAAMLDELRREGVKAEGASYFCVPTCRSCVGDSCPRSALNKAKYLTPKGRK